MNTRFVAVSVIGLVLGSSLTVLAEKAEKAEKKDGPGTATIKQSNYAALLGAPEKARKRKNPFEGDARAVAVGEKLFVEHCAGCHGDKAEGTKKAPTLLKSEVNEAAPGALFWILTNGVVRKGMPVWSKLPEQQRWQLVTFLKALDTPSEASETK